MWLTRLGISQPVLVSLTFALISVLGIYCYSNLPRELTPEVSFETVIVYTIWPGSSAGEVETQITNELEEELHGLSDVKRMSSTSTQGRSAIVIEFEPDQVNLVQAEQDVQSRVNRVTNLPEEAEEPNVMRIDSAGEAAFLIAVGSDQGFERLRTLTEELADAIEQIPNVASADIIGDRDREMWVEVDRERMEGLGLTLPEVLGAIRAQNRNMPGGEIKTGEREYLVRMLGEAERPEDIEQITLLRSDGGGLVRVGDIARVTSTFEEADVQTFLDGEPCLKISVTRMKRSNTIQMFEDLQVVLGRFEEQRGEECDATLFLDTSHEIRNRIHVLQGSAVLGLILVAVILMLFVGFRNMMFAIVGLPIAFLTTFILMELFGVTLNGVSLFALILVIGILVDDAIVVLENVSRQLEHGVDPKKAAEDGATEVALPVTASVSTTMAAFAPLLFVPGIMGQFIGQIPAVVLIALAASLFEVFFMLPHHVAHYGKASGTKTHRHPILSRFLKIYTVLLRFCIRWRVLVLILVVGLSALSIRIVPGFDMFPDTDAFPRFSVRFELPRTKTLEDTEAVMREIIAAVETLPDDELVSTLSTVGVIETEYQRIDGSHYGEVMALLTDDTTRDRTTREIINAMRPKIEAIQGPSRFTIDRPAEGPPSGADIEIRLRGEDLAVLDAMAEEVKQIYAQVGDELGVPGAITDIVDNIDLGKEEIIVRIDEERRRLYRVPTDDIFTTIGAGIEGMTAAEITVRDEEVDIIVRLPEEQRADPRDLLSLPLRSQTGGMIRLHEVIDAEIVQGYESIRHWDSERSVLISGTIDVEGVTTSESYGVIEPRVQALIADYPGYSYRVGGAEEENRKSLQDVMKALALGLFFIYFILAAQFQSFAQPLIIMTTIPFAAVGVIVGFKINGDVMTFPTIIGIVALAGIVVNDSLVLIDFINRSRRRQGNRIRAVLEGGRRRMRPIIMTSVTTIGGLLPMVYGIVGNPGLFRPMAIAVCWGLGFATFLVLLVIPMVYLVFDDLGRWVRRIFGMRMPQSIRRPSPPSETK